MSAWGKSVPEPVIYLQKRHKLDIISEIAAEKHALYAVLSVLRQSTFFLRIFRFGNPMEVHFMKRKPFFSARNIAYLAVLTALLIVLQLFASAIPMFGVTLNFSLIPIVLGGIFFGVWGGGLLGLISGLLTFLVTAVMGREPSTAFFFQASPVIKERHCGFLCRGCHGRNSEHGALSPRRRPDEGRGFSIPRHGSNGSGSVCRRVYSHLAEFCARNGHQRFVCTRDLEDRARRQQQGRKIPCRPRGERTSEPERRDARSHTRRTAYTANGG